MFVAFAYASRIASRGMCSMVHVSAAFQQKSDKSETGFVIHFEIFEKMV